MHKFALLLSLVICLSSTGIANAVEPPCTSPHGCNTCAFTPNVGWKCQTIKKDGVCSCAVGLPNGSGGHTTCEGNGLCDYTGAPSCPNPSPEGECPVGPPLFAPSGANTNSIDDGETLTTDSVGNESAVDPQA